MQYPSNWAADVKNNMCNPTDTTTIKNDKLYVTQYHHYAKLPKYQTYLQMLQKMVDSFQIIKYIQNHWP